MNRILGEVKFPDCNNGRKGREKNMTEKICLSDIKPGEGARVIKLETEGGMRRRLLDIGLIENTQVSCIGKSPGGDPSAYLIRGAVIAIRKEDAKNIKVVRCAGIADAAVCVAAQT